MASHSLSRKHFLHLCGAALALGVAGCDSDGDGGTDAEGSTGSTSSASTDPTNLTDPSQGTDPTDTTDPTSSTGATSSTPDPTKGSTGGSTSTGSTSGEGSTGSSTGESSSSETTSGEESSSSSSSSSSTSGENLCGDGATDIEIDVHGGHGIMIAADQLQPGTALNDLDITGASGHAHAIDLSADDVDALLAGEEVTVSSTTGAGHIHQVTLGCV
ncbi:MAG: hypothetical protein KUG77_23310 [Nannocystaceae bacterium]|nr:hypothetical protein [Nannocystaceae bacterium]